MDFAALILGLVLYYIRPQEWILSIQPFKPVTLVMALAVIGVVSKTGFSWRQLVKTPHDWAIIAFCVWIVVTHPDRSGAFHSVYPLYIFYVVAVLALTNIRRIIQFLTVWTLMIFAVAGLALLSLVGFDPTGAEYVTTYLAKGRLALGTSIFRNPNALGHSVVPVVLMIYFMFVWRRPIFVRIGSLPLFAVPLYCLFLTESKGAFLSAFATSVAAMAFGRPKIVQIAIVAFALTSGWAAVKTLPRMNEINKTKNDEAIQGRVAAFAFGYETFERGYRGLGMGTFGRNMYRYTGIAKSSHSSYVQIGTELGKGGFALFLAIVYCCLRTLFTSRTRNDEEERARRVLFAIIISYMISSWMVDFAYRVAFFLCVGAIAAYHRMMLQPETVTEESKEEKEQFAPVPGLTISGLGGPVPVAAVPTTMNQSTTSDGFTTSVLPMEKRQVEMVEEKPVGGIKWNRFQLIDIALIAVMFWAAVKLWVYAVHNM